MNKRPRSEISILAAKLRGKTAPSEEKARYEELEAQESASRAERCKGGPAPRTIWDLPIARRMWEADARDIGR